MHAPDVRWEGVSHDLIVKWTGEGRGALVTELLESRLKSVTAALNAAANLVNETLRRVNGGEWTGTAASTATQAMQVLRDFDDAMKQHGERNSVAAYGQSDNASWVRASVPAVVDTRAAQEPTGGLIDIINSTVDYQRQQQAAKEAEEQARRVMRQYEAMTTDRIRALPPLSPVPQVAFDVDEDTLPADPKPGGEPNERVSPPGGDTPDQKQGGPAVNGPRLPADGNGSPGTNPVSSAPPANEPARASGAQPPLHSGVGNAGEAARTGSIPVSGFGGVAGGPGAVGRGADVARGPLRAGQPVGAGPRAGESSGRGPQPGTRSGIAEMLGRGARQASGVAPIGSVGPARSDEDKDHQVKYVVPGSEIFEPDNEDGLLRDPFRPGSFVAPATIGDDDDE